MNTALIIIGMALAYIVGAFSMLKSVQLGLKWQIQTSEGKSPELAIPNPIKERREAKEHVTMMQQAGNTLDEWLNGVKE